MNITVIHRNVSKEQAAKMLGIQSYTDLPLHWVGRVAAVLSAMTGKNMYDLLLSSIVWCYDGSRIGYPYPLTIEAYGYLKALDMKLGNSLSIETEDRQFNVLSISA